MLNLVSNWEVVGALLVLAMEETSYALACENGIFTYREIL